VCVCVCVRACVNLCVRVRVCICLCTLPPPAQVSSEREALVDVNQEREKVARLLEGKAAEADALLDQLNQCSREKRFVCIAVFLYSGMFM
jgi:hypothetical protein